MEQLKFGLCLAAFALQAPVWAHDAEQGYKVVQVYSGDTVRIAGPDKVLRCQLSGVAAPTLDEPFGDESRQTLDEAANGKSAHVHIISYDGNLLYECRVWVEGRNIGLQQITLGMAKMKRPLAVDAQLLRAEMDAKARRVGLWSKASSKY